MTPKEFASWAVGYYGPWPAGMVGDVREHLAEKDGPYLDMLKRVCVETVPTRIGQVNGYPPDIVGLLALGTEVGARIAAEERRSREIALEAALLPAPEPETYKDLVQIDWVKVFEHGIKARERAEREGRL